jgi:NADH-quinone oxidoreductase subunit F
VLTPTDKEKLKDRFDLLVNQAKLSSMDKKRDGVPTIYIGMATCGLAAGASETKAAFEEILAERGIAARIVQVGCLGHCYAEPLVVIRNPEFPPICYHNVSPGKARALVKAFLEDGDPLFEYVLGAMEENDLIPSVADFPRFNLEDRVVMEHCGIIDPQDIHQYLAEGGYSGLVKSLALPPGAVIDEVLQSGLRGRGGAGFPTGLKWQYARNIDQENKVVVCNADEGDPGAYMDRTILESNPHQLLEGLAICAYAVGAGRAIVYVRAEYPLAVRTMIAAISDAREAGLLGKGILGTSFDPAPLCAERKRPSLSPSRVKEACLSTVLHIRLRADCGVCRQSSTM